MKKIGLYFHCKCTRFAYLLFTTLFFYANSSVAQVQKCTPENYDAAVINILFENDLWGSGKDTHYTHGTRFSYISSKKSDDCKDSKLGSLEIIREIAKYKMLKPIHLETQRISVILGQNIFTPEDITASNLQKDDRPYAGWLYIGFGFVKDADSTVDKVIIKNWSNIVDILELNVGVVGPWSYAEDIQTGWHKFIDTTTPNGWAHQLKNELGIVINYERKFRMDSKSLISKIQFDLTPSIGFALGNVHTNLASGAIVRLGYNMPYDYGPPRIRPGLQGSDFFEAKSGFSIYLFAGVEGRFVARNIFLDGNTFRNSHSVAKKPFIGDFQAGIVVTYKKIRVSLSNIFRTKEFQKQNEADEYGAVNISYHL